jgi:hypothetical protein
MSSVGDERPDERVADPANSFSLISAGARIMARRPVDVAVLWVAGAALVFANQAMRRNAGLMLLSSGLSPASLGFSAFNIVASGLLGALALRLFLDGRPWRAPDRSFWICAGLLMLASLESFVQGRLIIPGRPGLGDPGAMAVRSLVIFAGVLLQAWIFTRLLLWPIGALAGEAAMTPRRSWRLMDGYVLGYVAAVILINLPITLWGAGSVFVGVTTRHAPLTGFTSATTLAAALIGPPVQLLERAMAVLLYRALVGAAATALAGQSRKPS